MVTLLLMDINGLMVFYISHNIFSEVLPTPLPASIDDELLRRPPPYSLPSRPHDETLLELFFLAKFRRSDDPPITPPLPRRQNFMAR